jgi:hypothetical protein
MLSGYYALHVFWYWSGYRRLVLSVLHWGWILSVGTPDGTCYGSSHEELLQGYDPCPHLVVLISKEIVALLQVFDILGRLAQDLG